LLRHEDASLLVRPASAKGFFTLLEPELDPLPDPLPRFCASPFKAMASLAVPPSPPPPPPAPPSEGLQPLPVERQMSAVNVWPLIVNEMMSEMVMPEVSIAASADVSDASEPDSDVPPPPRLVPPPPRLVPSGVRCVVVSIGVELTPPMEKGRVRAGPSDGVRVRVPFAVSRTYVPDSWRRASPVLLPVAFFRE
jgi:hypothetical protein